MYSGGLTSNILGTTVCSHHTASLCMIDTWDWKFRSTSKSETKQPFYINQHPLNLIFIAKWYRHESMLIVRLLNLYCSGS